MNAVPARPKLRLFDYGFINHYMGGKEHPDFGTLKNPRTPPHWKKYLDRLER